ncbi:MAG: pitrilysin family protein [Alphaproteobacteria bacterium]
MLIRLFALAALFAVITASAPASAGVFNPVTFMLDNGMQVVVVTNKRAPVVVHMVWYKVGSADDPAGRSGIAHFLEHLMFKGTPTVPDGEFSKIVARNGGNQNAFTNRDYTGYFQKIAKDRLELVMGLEADRMVNLVLDDAVVMSERKVILEERRSRTDNNPSALWSEQLSAARYLAHPYRIPVIGWAHEIAGLKTEDILAFYRRYYAPDNAVLVVAGDITAEELRPMASRTYGAVPAAGIAARMRPQEPPHRAARRVELRDERVRQAEWSRTHLAPSYNAGDSEHAYALQVLADLLGGGSTSRLYRSLVIDQKVAVSAGAWYGATNLYLSQFGLYGTPAPGVDLGQLEAAVEAEVAALLTEGVSDDEVARVTARMVRGAIYARESLGTAARIFGAALTSGITVADVEAWPDRIAAVTAAGVMAAARAVLKPETSVTGLLLPAEGN